MKKMLPLLSLLLITSISNNLHAQQNPNNVKKVSTSSFLEKIKNKESLKNGWSRTIPQGSSVAKSKTTNNSFYRPIAAGVQEHDYMTMAFSPADSHVYYWNTNHGENENLISNYNDIFYYKNGLGIDLENIESFPLQNMEYLDFLSFPKTDSIEMYYNTSYNLTFSPFVDNGNVDSVLIPIQQTKVIYAYDANNNMIKQEVYENNIMYMRDTASFSATNKKLTHYRSEDYGWGLDEYINKFTYDVNDKLIAAYYAEYYGSSLSNETVDSIFTISPTKDSIVNYENYGSGLEENIIKVHYHTNGLSDSVHTYWYPSSTFERTVFNRDANNQVIDLAYSTDYDSSNVFMTYTVDNQIESAYQLYYWGGIPYYSTKETYEYDTLGNLIKYEDFSNYDDLNNVWLHDSYDRIVNIYYELYSEPCSLSVAYNRLDPNDTLCTDIELTFVGETLPIEILVTSSANPTGTNYTITTLPFELTGMCPDQYTIAVEDNKGCTDTLTFAIQDLTSIHDANLEDLLRVYPNPAKDMVLIEGLKVGATLTLIDMFGRKISSTKTTASSHQLDVSTLASGMYTIQIQLDGAIANKKVVITK